MKSDRNYLVALSKCKFSSMYNGKPQWYSYTTASETLELIRHGAEPISFMYFEEVILNRKKQGDSKPRLFWFVPKHELKIDLNKKRYNEIS